MAPPTDPPAGSTPPLGALPRWARLSGVLTLLLSLLFLVLAVYVGVHGNIPLSNDLAAGALAAMAIFALVNLSTQRSVEGRREGPTASPAPPRAGAP